jgi:hypothetical protein
LCQRDHAKTNQIMSMNGERQSAIAVKRPNFCHNVALSQPIVCVRSILARQIFSRRPLSFLLWAMSESLNQRGGLYLNY